MNAKRRLTIGANTEIEVADRLKKGGTSECPLHHQTTTYEPIQTFANGEAVTFVEGCCHDAIDKVERALNLRR